MFDYFREIIEEYKGKKHIRGKVDCNLLILKLFDLENHDKMYGRYSTIRGGIRVSNKVYGVSSIYEYLQKNEAFREVPRGFQRPFDVVAFKDTHNVYVCLGKYWFGVGKDDIFSFVSPLDYKKEGYVVYRKELI